MRGEPGNPEYLSNLGALLGQVGRWKEALPHLEKAIELEPERFAAALHYGAALAMARDFEKGLRWLRRATSIKPRSDAAWGTLADAATAAGEHMEALDAARRAAEIAPSDQTHRARLEKLRPGGTQPAVADRGRPAETDLSQSLDQIFIR